MSLILDEKQGWQVFCDYCGELIGNVDKDWMKHYGFSEKNTEEGKIPLECRTCNTNNIVREVRELRSGNKISDKSVRIILDTLGVKEEKMGTAENIKTITETKMTTTKAVKTPADMDWASIEKAIKGKAFKLLAAAKELKISPADLKTLLVNKFGEQIEFKRGRNGGVFWKTN